MGGTEMLHGERGQLHGPLVDPSIPSIVSVEASIRPAPRLSVEEGRGILRPLSLSSFFFLCMLKQPTLPVAFAALSKAVDQTPFAPPRS